MHSTNSGTASRSTDKMPSTKRSIYSADSEAPAAQRRKTSTAPVLDLTEESEDVVSADESEESEDSEAPPLDQIRIEKDAKVDRIREAMTLPPGYVFVVDGEDDDEYTGRSGGCISLNKTLDGALSSAVKYLDDYGIMDVITSGIDDENDDDDEDQDEETADEWRNINVFLDMAELSGVGERPMLTLEVDDEESGHWTVTIEQMKLGA